jgi:hypothetical protein
MSKKLFQSLKRLFLFALGLYLVYKTFLRTNSPEKAIKKAFSGSKYESLIPFIQAQAKHETGNFTSSIFVNSKNMFGMGVPEKRNSLRSGVFVAKDGVQYSKFDSVLDSAKDFRLYLENQNFPIPKTEQAYVWELKRRGYFTDSYLNYLLGLQRFL